MVEDEALVSMNVCEFLVDQEFTVFAAQDVEEALGVLHQLDGRIDLVFTDVNMPGAQDGFDLVREVSRRWPEIRILVTSAGLNGQEPPADLRHFGPILAKPYRLDVLALKIIDAIFPPSEPIDLLAT
ncbi:response regulator receiver protein [Sphingobium chungbukense]|uniref:Response regulator receiver protein n=1 Tax=Sphingobium chungbukense TaxID=56193 RepID=A0A0M3AHJ2_9SPHN|nr:response regulator receiver protein [Sphingobium chungbukense]